MDIRTTTFKEAFLEVNNSVLVNPDFEVETRNGLAIERVAITYTVSDPTTFNFYNMHIDRIDPDYAFAFYTFMMSGRSNIEGEFDDWPGTKKFFTKKPESSLPANFNSLYGPRIINQLDNVERELKYNPNSRRGVIMILTPDDQILLASGETIEYPCTVCTTYFIRQDRLYAHCLMRSENTAVVMQLDMFLQGKMLVEMAKRLGVEVGEFSSTITNAHIFERDFDYVNNFLEKEM
jgi:hypothetical protein